MSDEQKPEKTKQTVKLPDNVTPNRLIEETRGDRKDNYALNKGQTEPKGHIVTKGDKVVYRRTNRGTVTQDDKV